MKHSNLVSLAILTLAAGFTDFALADSSTTIINISNVCINSTFKSTQTDRGTTTWLAISRRVNFNPETCNLTMSNIAHCSADNNLGNDPMFLSAYLDTDALALVALGGVPRCTWNCGGCGIIKTDGGQGLPVEQIQY